MRIYILNTTRFYHEDFEEYPGAWFSCPVDFEEVRERLGVQNEEEIEIEDFSNLNNLGKSIYVVSSLRYKEVSFI